VGRGAAIAEPFEGVGERTDDDHARGGTDARLRGPVRPSLEGSISAEDHLDAPSDGATPDVADDDEREDDPEPIGLDALVDDAEHGRREAPLADDPSHRVRSR
jgi:hypothetical protein